MRCSGCGRFPAWDAYRAAWWCENCQTTVTAAEAAEVAARRTGSDGAYVDASGQVILVDYKRDDLG